MTALGSFFFRHRNLLFPIVFVTLLLGRRWPIVRAPGSEYWLIGAGALIALAGQTVRAVTVGLAYVKRGGKDKKVYAESLVQGGMFAHCRNPMYLGNLCIAAGMAIASNSLPFVALGLPFFWFAYRCIVAAEEDYLRRKFGPEFESYCARVHRFLPDLRGIGATLRGMRFHWRRLLVKEYQTPFLWMVGLLLLVMRQQTLDLGHQSEGLGLWMSTSLLVLLAAMFFLARFLKKSKLVRAD
jgi:protein-S-isoprenylcysteine O-methyltransferase Ste14